MFWEKGYKKFNMFFMVFILIIKGELMKIGYVVRFCKSVFVVFVILNIFI